MMRSEAVFVFR